jgi:hypothetical protein
VVVCYENVFRKNWVAYYTIPCNTYFLIIFCGSDRLCGLVVRVPAYRSRGPGTIPGATGFSEKQCVWNWVHSAS